MEGRAERERERAKKIASLDEILINLLSDGERKRETPDSSLH